MISFTVRDASLTFAVKVQPRAARTELAGEMEGVLKIRLAAPPVDGAANEELIRFLARLFDISRRQVTIVSGLSARNKIIRLAGVTEQAAARILNGA